MDMDRLEARDSEAAVRNVAPGEPGRFLSALFEPDDVLLIRHVETWTEDKRKRSVVHHTRHNTAGGLLGGDLWAWHLMRAAATRSNLFFGVCPRPRGDECHDLACQVRVVRCLWADVDDARPAEARERCRGAGLPDPSIGVSTGHWSQLYWLLDEPLLIDDAGESFPILSRHEWANGRKVKAYYREGEAAGVEERVDPPALLSERAWRVQEAVAGIALAIGGDHTFDLARLLRLPGAMNRKDERAGREPVPCTLAWCDPKRRHRFEDFPRKSLRGPRPGKQAATDVPVDVGADLPGTPGRSFDQLTPAQAARFDQLLAGSRDAGLGDRSDADHALLCHCVRTGLDKEDAWERVREVGKFAERGGRYFDTGWRNAAGDVAREDERVKEILGGDPGEPSAGSPAARMREASKARGEDHALRGDAAVPRPCPVADALPQAGAERRRRGYRLADLMCLPPPEWLIQEHFHRGGLAALYGPPGSYKSFLALDMALCIATGKPFLGTFEARKGKAAYVCSEGRQGLRARVRSWLRHHDAGMPADIIVIPEVFDMTQGEEATALADVIGESLGDHDVDLLVIDTLARNFGGGDENAAKDMNRFVNVVGGLGRFLDAAVLVVHHTGKDEGRERGHSALRGAADTMIKMNRSGKADAVVAVEKQKDAEELEPYLLSPRKVDLGDGQGSIVLAGHDQLRTKYQLAKPDLKDFLAALSARYEGRPFSQAEAREAAGQARSTVSRRFNELAGKGLLVRSGDEYLIPPAALALASARRGF